MGEDREALRGFTLAAGRYFVRDVGDGASLILGPRQTAAALSPTGTDIARALLAGEDESSLRRHLSRAYQRVDGSRLDEAIGEIRGLIAGMAEGRGRYDHADLDEPASPLFRSELEAPLAADIDVVPGENATPDAAQRQRQFVDELAAATVPFVTFVLPPARPAEHVSDAIEHAAALGLSPGVRARATDVLDTTLEALAAVAPSRLEIYYAEPVEDSHDRYFGAGDRDRAVAVISRGAELGLDCMALVPLTERTLPLLEDTADDLRSMGCRAGAAYALVAVEASNGDALAPEQLRQAAALVEELDGRDGESWSWLPPVRRGPGLSLGYQARRGPRTVRPGAVRVGVSGSVMPGEGAGLSAGRLLAMPWSDIWNAPALEPLREPRQPGTCLACPFVRVCEAGCVTEPAGFATEPEMPDGEEAA